MTVRNTTSCVPEITIDHDGGADDGTSENPDLGYNPDHWIVVGEGDEETYFPNTENCAIIDERGGLRFDSPIFAQGFLGAGEMIVFKMDMHEG